MFWGDLDCPDLRKEAAVSECANQTVSRLPTATFLPPHGTTYDVHVQYDHESCLRFLLHATPLLLACGEFLPGSTDQAAQIDKLLRNEHVANKEALRTVQMYKQTRAYYLRCGVDSKGHCNWSWK